MHRISTIGIACVLVCSLVRASDDSNEMPSLEIKRVKISMESAEDIAARDMASIKAQLKSASPEKVKVLKSQVEALKVAAARDSI